MPSRIALSKAKIGEKMGTDFGAHRSTGWSRICDHAQWESTLQSYKIRLCSGSFREAI